MVIKQYSILTEKELFTVLGVEMLKCTALEQVVFVVSELYFVLGTALSPGPELYCV
jgi:hypothetical protein